MSLCLSTTADRDEALAKQRLTPDDVRRLYDRHGPALMLYARTFVSDMGAAEDVVHSVFLKLIAGGERTVENPAAYSYRAVRNEALNAKRRALREQPTLDGEVWFEPRTHGLEIALALQKALAQLVPEQREVVIMRVWSGLTFEEIAEAAGAPTNTVASRYRYALGKLRAALYPAGKM